MRSARCKIRDNSGVRVLLIVQDEVSRQKYVPAIADTGAQVFTTASLFHFDEAIAQQTYHGIFLDVLTKMAAIKENKAEVYRLTERFPAAHLRIDKKTGAIQCFYVSHHPGGSIRDFVDKLGRASEPVTMRISPRIALHLPVLVYRSPESKRPERAVTKDVSPQGCFIVSFRRRKRGEIIILRFPGLADAAGIKAQVRNVVKWGDGGQLPGFGVKFEELSLSQVNALSAICSPPTAMDSLLLR